MQEICPLFVEIQAVCLDCIGDSASKRTKPIHHRNKRLIELQSGQCWLPALKPEDHLLAVARERITDYRFHNLF